VRRVALVLSGLVVAALASRAEEPAAAESIAATAAEKEEFLAELGRRTKELKRLHVTFRQEKKLRILRRPRLSEGDLVYAGGKMSLRLRGRDGELESEMLLADGELKIHYPALARLEVMALGRGGAAPPAGGMGIPFFAEDWRELEKDHDVRLEWKPPTAAGAAGTAGAARGAVLTLTPRDVKSPVRSLSMTFAGHDLREYRQVDASGDEVRIEVLSWKTNEEPPPGRFQLAVPPGTKTVPLDPSKKSP
jgi:hypothetical protein